MKAKLNLMEIGLVPLSESNIKEIYGGLPWWSPAAFFASLAVSAINNFDDIRDGISDGYNGTPRY